MARIRKEKLEAEYQAGLHRRRAGAFWAGVGGGLGWGYSPGGNLEWDSRIRISAITTVTGMFHVLPEVGWMYSDNFALALQGRIEFIKQQQGTWKNPNNNNNTESLPTADLTGAPTSKALAGFARAIWYMDLSSSGNLQFSYSGDLGGGFIRFPVLPSNLPTLRSGNDPNYVLNSSGVYSPNPKSAIPLTDTRPVGPFLLGGSAGIIYHLSQHFALALDGRILAGMPKFGALIEGAFSLQVAIGGAAAKAPGSEEGEEEGGEGGGPLNDAPPPADAPSEEE